MQRKHWNPNAETDIATRQPDANSLTILSKSLLCKVSPNRIFPTKTAKTRRKGLTTSGLREFALAFFLTFEPNEGQADPSVKFLSHGHGYTLFLKPNEAVFSLSGGSSGMSLALSDADSVSQPFQRRAGSLSPSSKSVPSGASKQASAVAN